MNFDEDILFTDSGHLLSLDCTPGDWGMITFEVMIMLMHETAKATNLTKKAIIYYTEQGLISPVILKNGYRDYSETDIIRLKEIYILRNLGLSTRQIKMILDNHSKETLQKLCTAKELSIQRESIKKDLLEQLAAGKSYDDIKQQLEMLDASKTITEKLLDAFPGYYGRFICLHFARFLNEPIATPQQQTAYNEIIYFLDNIPSIDFPEDLKKFLYETTKQIQTEHIFQILESTEQSIAEPEPFISKNKKILENYLAFKQSKEYLESPIYRIQKILKEFNKTNGYNDIFIPAMIKLSPSYAKYYAQLQKANQMLLKQFPEIHYIINQ